MDCETLCHHSAPVKSADKNTTFHSLDDYRFWVLLVEQFEGVQNDLGDIGWLTKTILL